MPRVVVLDLRQVGELVQRIRRAAGTARRRAEQREAFDAIGRGHRELLRDHPAEAHTDDARRVPNRRDRAGRRVGGVVGHRVRTRRDRAAAQPALVVNEHVEVVREQLDRAARWSRSTNRSR